MDKNDKLELPYCVWKSCPALYFYNAGIIVKIKQTVRMAHFRLIKSKCLRGCFNSCQHLLPSLGSKAWALQFCSALLAFKSLSLPRQITLSTFLLGLPILTNLVLAFRWLKTNVNKQPRIKLWGFRWHRNHSIEKKKVGEKTIYTSLKTLCRSWDWKHILLHCWNVRLRDWERLFCSGFRNWVQTQ